MNNIFILILLLSIFIISSQGSDPMKCTEMSVTSMEYGNEAFENNFVISANFKLFYSENASNNLVEVSSIVAFDYNLKKPALSLCSEILKDCISDLSTPYNFSTTYDYFGLWATFATDVGSEDLSFWFGYVDEGNFNHHDGPLFLTDQACIVNNYEVNRIIQCCNKFEPVPKAQKAYPKCKNFKSRVTILNVNDNFSINSTASLNILIDGTTVSTANFTYTDNVLFTYSLNECGSIELNQESCNLPDGDSKAMVSVYTEHLGSLEPTIGRFITRRGQTLASEGTPYTPDNKCLYYNTPINNDFVLHGEFCCQDFEKN